MEPTPEFVEFRKIPRLSREIIVTEKIDGTNGIVYVPEHEGPCWAGSRNRWLSPGADHHGFGAWVHEHNHELRGLGPGYHFGEWWGSGIARGYGLTKGEKRFSLFNVSRWTAERPACCGVVPVLARAPVFDTAVIEAALDLLRSTGSVVAPGFMRPEGVVVFHAHGNVLFKKTLEKDEAPKGA